MKFFHKIPVIFCLLTLLCANKNSVFAQFIGGNADGLAYNTLTQGACTPTNNNIYSGGTADGFSKNILTQGVCTPTNNNIYGGGNADGFSYNNLAQTICVPANNNIYGGGNADGFSYNNLAQTVCVPANNNIYRGSAADGFSGVSRCTGCNTASCTAALPITLLSFTARLTKDKTVLLEWVTTTEINNDYFTIEKTKNDMQYELVGQIDGAGNSTVSLNYQFTDFSPYQGTSYYRLKQTDFDGKYTYSQLVPINLSGIDIISISPNPAIDEFEYKIGSTEKMSVQVKVVDILGQIVINKTETIEKGITQKRLNISALSSGTYILQIITENKEVRGKQFQIK